MLVYDILPTFSEIFSSDLVLVKLQPLWLLLNSTSKWIGPDFFVFQIIHALIINSIIFYFFSKYSRYFFTSILLYFLIFYGLYNFEILRESIAICFFLLSIDFYLNNKWFKYYFLAFLSLGFHYSAIILFVLPFLKKIKINIYSLFIMSLFAIILNPYFLKAINLVSGSDGLSTSIATYFDYEYSFFGLLTILLLNITYPFILLKFTSKKKSYYNSNLLLFTKFYIISGVLSLLFFVFFRFSNYFIPFLVLLISDTIHRVFRSKKIIHLRRTVAFCIFLSLTTLHTYKYFSDTSDKVTTSKWYNHWVPYHSIFDPKIDPIREELSKQH